MFSYNNADFLVLLCQFPKMSDYRFSRRSVGLACGGGEGQLVCGLGREVRSRVYLPLLAGAER